MDIQSRDRTHEGVYLMSLAEEKKLKYQHDAYLQAVKIEPAKSPFGVRVLFARKKDDTLPLCIDYRTINNITQKYPLPHIYGLIANMAGAAKFIKVELQQGYHQIRVKPEHVRRTVFHIKLEVFNFA